jgi:hypothetical protein
MKFNEKKFLKVLYKDYKKRNTNFTHNCELYTFDNLISGILCQNFPALIDREKNGSLSYKWTVEAEQRGLVKHSEGAVITFHFTELGLSKAKEVSQPIKSFYRKHWKWIIVTLLSAINIVGAIIWKAMCKQ